MKLSILETKNTDYRSINLEISKKISRKEQKFLKYLFEKLYIERLSKIMIHIDEMKKSFKVEDLHKFLRLIRDKRIIAKIDETIIFEFSLFNNYFLENNNLIIFSQEREYIHISKRYGNILASKILSLIYITSLVEQRLFNLIVSSLSERGSFIISVEELKRIIVSDNKYERFFDIESNYIKPVIDSLNIIFEEKFTYNKIKKSNSKNSKIMSVKFSSNLIIEDDKIKIKDFLLKRNMTEEYIKEVIEGLRSSNFDNFYKNYLYVQEHFKEEDRDDLLIKSINEDFIGTRFFKKLKKYDEYEVEKVVTIDKNFKSYREFYNGLRKLVINYSTFDVKNSLHIYSTFRETLKIVGKELPSKIFKYESNSFLKSMKNLELYREFTYENDKYIYMVEYNTSSDSRIFILKK